METIPQYLDEPEKILFWKVEEFSVLFGGVFVGLLCSHVAIGLVAGVVASSTVQHFYKRYGNDALRRLACWHLPALMVYCSAFNDASIRVWGR